MTRIERRYKVTHLALLADQNPRTIKRRIDEGLIKVTQLADGSKRIPESEVLRYLGIDAVPGDDHNGADQ
jgi:predicted site-specific integrase-resolvase